MLEKLLLVTALLLSNPLFAQNFSELIKIVASDRSANDRFGITVAISGDYAIIGAYWEDEDASGTSTMSAAGSAYLFKNNVGTWSQVQKIVASDRAEGDNFGWSVDISGDYAIVGARYEDEDTSGANTVDDAGSAYIFWNDAGTWIEIQKITAWDRSFDDYFGYSVAISNDHAIVGALYDDQDASGANDLNWAGSAYIFKNTAGSWGQVQKIVASDREANDQFSISVSISDDYAIVGANAEDEDTSGANSFSASGSAYVFMDSAGTWIQVQKLVSSDRAAYDQFGISLDISDDFAIIGAFSENEDAFGANTILSAGSAYIFNNNAGNWSQVQKITASDRGAGDQFGWSVAISGDHIIVGAGNDDDDAFGVNDLYNAGSAYIFENNVGTWIQVQKLVASDRAAEDYFGLSVDISGDHAITGAHWEDENASGSNTVDKAGSAYIFGSSTISILENDLQDLVLVFPNPTNGVLNVKLRESFNRVSALITNTLGQEVREDQFGKTDKFQIFIDGPPGVYFVELQLDRETLARFKVLKH